MTVTELPWWKTGVVYQIYPASFKDSNNDGVGDLPGIIQSLDYIKSIGVDIVWICPMYDSPQIDMGYDISDYTKVYPPYGTVQDMEVLVDEAHKRGMRLILDLVVNHTSDKHAWFEESRSSKDNPKRDWYIWKPAKYDANGQRHPPTNWRSNFGGSAWAWDEHTQEYYLHLFCPEQPDLNWENEETRQAIYRDAMIFWLDKGVDGFRIDTVNMYSKPPTYPDAPITDPGQEFQAAGLTYCNGPRMNEYLSEMGAILERYDAMSVGECPSTPNLQTVVDYVGASHKRLNMVFQFDVVDVGIGSVFKYGTTPRNWRLKQLKQAVDNTQSFLTGTDGWSTSFGENHDQSRSISRFGTETPEYRERSGKMLAMLFASLSGTLFIYQGQEIGMINAPEEWPIENYIDVESVNYYNMVAERSGNDPEQLKAAKAAVQYLSRDNARNPMQWTSAANGGFTADGVKPWMRVNTSTSFINVAEQTARKDSVLAFWRQILQVRKTYQDLLIGGDFQLVDEDNEKVFAFVKRKGGKKAAVVLNFSDATSEVPRFADVGKLKLVCGNVADSGDMLEPWEGRIYVET